MRQLWDLVHAAPRLPRPAAEYASTFQQRRLRSALRRGGDNINKPHDAIRAVAAQALELLLQSSSVDPRTPAVERGPSKLGGDGIFATRAIAAGQLVAFFAGRSYYPVPDGVDGDDDSTLSPSWVGDDASRAHSTWASNDKVLLRNDGSRIDGEAIESDAAFAAVHRCYAIGQLCNHPDRAARPNTMGWPLEFDVAALRKRGVSRNAIPNKLHEAWYFSTRSGAVPLPANADVPGLGMITTRNIQEGDELLFDYELPDFAARPQWYTARDAQLDAAAEDAERAPEEGVLEVGGSPHERMDN